MVDIFIIRANAWGFFVLTQTFLLLAAVLCGSFFPRQTAAQAQEASSVSVSTSIQVTAEALAGCALRASVVGRSLRRGKQELRSDERAAGRQGQSASGNFRRRRRGARIRGRLRCRDGETCVAILDDSRARRVWLRELARRTVQARRRHHVDARHVRSGTQYNLLGHQQSGSGFRWRPTPGG